MLGAETRDTRNHKHGFYNRIGLLELGLQQPQEFGAGIVLYFMLSKSTPFVAPTPQKTIEKTMEGKAEMGWVVSVQIDTSF